MSKIPDSILSKFYEKDSLRNTDGGFEVVFRNRLAPTTLIGVGPLRIDGDVYADDQVMVQVERPKEGHSRPPVPLVRSAKEIDEKKTVQFGVNSVARVAVAGRRLSPGQYKVALSLRTREVGDIVVTAMDEIYAEGQ